MRWSEEQLTEYRAKRQGQPSPGAVAPPAQIIRQSRKGMNKTERRFEIERLQVWRSMGQILEYDYEAVTLKIANGCRYTPDYWVITNDGRTQFYEIKARKMIWDDAIVKLKVAAAIYDTYEFWLCAWDRNGWTVERVLP
jgi:hypothetical protein